MVSKFLMKKVKVTLIQRDMTQVQLANELGVSRQTLNNILHGRCNNSHVEDALFKFTGIMNLTLKELQKEIENLTEKNMEVTK